MTGTPLSWVVVPGTPILLPEVAGAGDPAADLRQHCLTALRPVLDLVPDGAPVTVLAAGPSRSWEAETPYDLARLTGGVATPGSLPLALAVGRSLVRTAGWAGDLGLRTVADVDEDAPTGVVVAVGDGSLYRHERGGPGPQDPRAVPFDDAVRSALATGDANALAGLEEPTAVALGVTGRVPWRLMGRAAGGRRVVATLIYAGDPFGPYAVVARWDFFPLEPPELILGDS